MSSASVSAGTSMPLVLPASLPREGDVFAEKYLIEQVLGEGGMCVVFAARHLQLEQRVAIKVLRPEMLYQPEVIERFQREGKAAIQIRSDHVVRIFDVGSDEASGPYIVMECLEGSDLDALLLANGPLPIDAAVDYMLQASEALAEAHALGIVHRDVKPANIFLTRRADGSPLVKVLDFGISKIGGESKNPKLTAHGAVMGSPRYMSPEQMHGTRDVDARCDVWALGVVLYELLVGEPPFTGATVESTCAAILRDTARPLVSRRRDVPRALSAAVGRALEKKRDERYATIAELAKAIAPFGTAAGRMSARRIVGILHASGEHAVSSRNVSGSHTVSNAWGTTDPSWEDDVHSRPTRMVRRGGVGAAVAAAVVLMAGSGAAATWYMRHPAPQLATQAMTSPAVPSPPPALGARPGEPAVVATPAAKDATAARDAAADVTSPTTARASEARRARVRSAAWVPVATKLASGAVPVIAAPVAPPAPEPSAAPAPNEGVAPPPAPAGPAPGTEDSLFDERK